MIEFILDIVYMIYGWVIGKISNLNQNNLNLIESLNCISDSKGRTYSETILTEDCVKEIYKWIEKGTGKKINLSYEKTKTINEIWIELYKIGIDIEKKEIIDIIKHIESKK